METNRPPPSSWRIRRFVTPLALLATTACSDDALNLSPELVPEATVGSVHADNGAASVSTLSERDILELFYDSAGGSGWTNNDDWLSDKPLGEWYGVEVNDSGRVIKLDLDRNGLSGTLTRALDGLTELESLELYRNNLAGGLPAELGNLASLRELHLWHNSFSGQIPEELGDLDSLTSLHVGTNGFSGSIPPELGDLANLTSLNLGVNSFSGSIPAELGNLTKLEVLNFGRNNLSGSVPSSLGDLTNLEELYLDFNQLSGLLPRELPEGLANLDYLDWSVNDGLCAPDTDFFDTWLAGIEDVGGDRCSDRDLLKIFYDSTGGDGWTRNDDWLSYRPLGEWYGVEVNDAGRVTKLDLDGNGLVGTLPGVLEELTELETLELYRNNLAGGLPAALGNLAKLKELHLWHNSFSGQIPEELGDLDSLTSLHVGNNGFSGSIPPELGDLANLTSLNLGVNSFSGSIPAELGNLTKLEFLNFGSNNLSGSVPSSLGDLTNLEELYLDFNQLSGLLPRELPEGLANLDYLEWHSNDGLCAPDTDVFDTWLAGIFDSFGPRCSDRELLRIFYDSTGGDGWTRNDNWLSYRPLGEWYGVEVNDSGRVTKLDLDGNGLVGTLPGVLEELTELETLELYRNNLAGGLPAALGNLAKLKELHLWHNSFSGQIPEELADLDSLTSLHIGTNGFSGSIPPELGGLANLRSLNLGVNSFSGSIPAELGNLTNLEYLNFGTNNLSGSVPSSLGNLTSLEELYLDSNQLSGSIPPELPAGLANLDSLHWYSNDGLCAPDTAAFDTWLAGIGNTIGPRCAPPGPPPAPTIDSVVAGANPGTLDVVWSWSLGSSACDNVVAYFVDYKKSSESAWNTYAAWDANDADHGTYQVWEDLGTSVSFKRFTIGPSTTGHNPGEVGVTLDDVQYDVRVHIYSRACEAGDSNPYGTSAPMSGWPGSSGGS